MQNNSIRIKLHWRLENLAQWVIWTRNVARARDARHQPQRLLNEEVSSEKDCKTRLYWNGKRDTVDSVRLDLVIALYLAFAGDRNSAPADSVTTCYNYANCLGFVRTCRALRWPIVSWPNPRYLNVAVLSFAGILLKQDEEFHKERRFLTHAI